MTPLVLLLLLPLLSVEVAVDCERRREMLLLLLEHDPASASRDAPPALSGVTRASLLDLATLVWHGYPQTLPILHVRGADGWADCVRHLSSVCCDLITRLSQAVCCSALVSLRSWARSIRPAPTRDPPPRAGARAALHWGLPQRRRHGCNRRGSRC